MNGVDGTGVGVKMGLVLVFLTQVALGFWNYEISEKLDGAGFERRDELLAEIQGRSSFNQDLIASNRELIAANRALMEKLAGIQFRDVPTVAPEKMSWPEPVYPNGMPPDAGDDVFVEAGIYQLPPLPERKPDD